VLKTAALSLEDDFFAMGGHSLLAARLIAQLNRELEVQLQLRALFESPTVEKLADAIAQMQGKGVPVARPPLVRRADRSRAPLTLMQQRVAFMEDIQPGRLVYHAPSAHRLRGPMDLAAFNRAYREMARRQEAFHTRIVRHNGVLEQRMDPAQAEEDLPLLDLSHLPETEREAALLAHMNHLVSETFQLDQAPLVRSHLYKLAEDEHAMFLMAHHIVWDGASFDVLYKELSTLYAAFASGQPSPLPELPLDQGDFAEWHNAWMGSEEIRQQLQYWEQLNRQTAAMRPTPIDRVRPDVASGHGATAFLTLEHTETEALRAIARQTGSPVSVVCMAVYAALMSQWMGDPAPGIGLPVRGRPSPELEGIMGFFNNMLPMRVLVHADLTGLDWIRHVRQQVTQAFANQDVPFEMIAQHLKVKSGLYQVLFNYQDVRERILRWGDLDHERINLQKYGATEDLNFWLIEEKDRISGGFQYDTDVLLPATGDALRDQFLALLRQLMQHPQRSLRALMAPTDTDATAVAVRSQALAQQHPTRDVHAALVEQANQSPQATAVRVGERTVSRAELLERLTHCEPLLADALRGQPGTRHCVAVALADPVAQLVVCLTALRMGLDCLPLTPTPQLDGLSRSDIHLIVAEPGLITPAAMPRIGALQVPGAQPMPAQAGRAQAHATVQRVPITARMAAASATRLAVLTGLHHGQRVWVNAAGDPALTLTLAIAACMCGAEVLLIDDAVRAAPADISTWLQREAPSVAHLTTSQARGLAACPPGLTLLLDVTESDPAVNKRLLAAGVQLVSIHRPAVLGLPVAGGRLSDATDNAVCGLPLLDDVTWVRGARDEALAFSATGELCIGPIEGGLRTGESVRWRADGVLQAVRPDVSALPSAATPAEADHAVQHVKASTVPNGTAAVLARIWQELLDVAQVQPSDNFFELGGNSLLAMRAVEETRLALGIDLEARRYVFETLAQLAASADAAMGKAPGTPACPPLREPVAVGDANSDSPPRLPHPPRAGWVRRVLNAWPNRS